MTSSMLEGKIKIDQGDKQVPGFGVICRTMAQSQLFKFEYLWKMGRAAKLAKTQEVLIQLGNDTPLSLLFQLAEMGSLNFFLAPLIEEK